MKIKPENKPKKKPSKDKFLPDEGHESDLYQEATEPELENMLKDDDVDDEYGEYDNGPNGRNSSNWQDVQDGFSSSGRGNALQGNKIGFSKNYRSKSKGQSKNILPDTDEDQEDPKRWRTPMGDW
jgi:hypothetical protein